MNPFDALMSGARQRLVSLATWEELHAHPWALKNIAHPSSILDKIALSRKTHFLKVRRKCLEVNLADIRHRDGLINES
nr:hypothetical protein [Xanthomonas citri]